jgi:hypothetical protein
MHERRSAVDSSNSSTAQTIDAQTIDARTVVLTMPELQSSHVLMRAMPTAAVLGHGRPHTPTVSNWRGKGEICPQRTLTAAATQGGRIAGFGAYDVTDTKFFTQMGPPSCSPPV